MKDWAAREVEIAYKREHVSATYNEWNYRCACYESALKAFYSLMSDGHSSYSIGVATRILNSLIEGRSLTPIKDTDDIWDRKRIDKTDEYTCYQCLIMSSLFKYVYDDGTVKYKDIDRLTCINIHTKMHSSFGFIKNIVDDMYPITMPYTPTSNKYKLYWDEFLYDPKNGDFDTIALFHVVTPDYEFVKINSYFKEENGEFVEISKAEYHERNNGPYVATKESED